MDIYIVIKHIHCIPCDLLIDVKKYRSTARDKAIRDARIKDRIGKRKCPKCERDASISTPIAVWNDDSPRTPKRDASGNVIIRYE